MTNPSIASAHTAGPWLNSGLDIVGSDNNTTVVASVNGTFSNENEIEANALLIAAAPDLLEALKMIVENTEKDGYVNAGLLDEAIAAIAKAQGK